MQLLILTPGFPQDEQDTTCIPFLQDFVLGMSEHLGAPHIKVISFQYPFSEANYTWHEVEVFSAGGRNKKGMRRMFTWRRVMKQAGLWMTENTVIHSFWLTEASLIGQQLQEKYGCRHIATIMGQDVLPSNRYLKKLSAEKMYIVAPNERTASLLHSQKLQESAIIPHAIMPLIFARQQRTTDLIWVGSFIALKQPEQFLLLVKELLSTNPGISCCMIGEGPLLNKTKQRAEREELPVEICGKLERPDVLQRMERSRILVHTSNYEGHSTVISEALSKGCRVVCYDVGHTHSDLIHTAGNLEHMTRIVGALLDTDMEYLPVYPDQMSEMLQQYLDLYSGRTH